MGIFHGKKDRIQLNPKLINAFKKRQLETEPSVFTISTDGSSIAWCSYNTGYPYPPILVRNMKSEKTHQLMLPKEDGGSYSIKTYPYQCNSICYSSDGKDFIATLENMNIQISECAIWETSTWELLHRIPLDFSMSVGSMALSPQKDKLAIAGYPDIYLLDLQTAEFRILEGHGPSLIPSPLYDAVDFIAFHPDGKTLFSAGDDGLVICWDLSKSIKDIRGAVLGKHEYAVTCGSPSPDGAMLATSNAFDFEEKGGSILIWDVDRKRVIKKFTKGVHDLSFVSDTDLISLYTKEDKDGKPVAEVVSLLDARKGKILKSKEIKKSLFKTNLLHEGRYLMGQDWDDGLHIWQLY